MTQEGKVLVIGLDGATFRVLLPWIEGQILPSLKRLMDRGCWGTLESIVPAITPPAWTTFFTGRNPGKHGIFNFTASEPGEHEDLRLVSTRDIGCDTLWDMLGAGGKRVAVMNVPMSYPVWNVNGFMISCMYTPRSVGVSTHPPELAAELGAYQTSERLRIKVPPNHPRYKTQALAYLDEIARITDLHANTALRLMKSKPWDLFAVVFMTLDRMQHFFWRYMVNPLSRPKHNPLDPEIATLIERILRRLDAGIGQLLEQAGPAATTFIVSDHGFGPEITRTVNLHRLFKERGWLTREEFWFAKRLYRKTLSKLAGAERRFSFDKKAGVIHWAGTKVWAEIFGPTCVGVRINRASVYRGGTVADAEYEELRSEIRKVLTELKDDNGSPILGKVQTREEVFSGPLTCRAPDLIGFFAEGYSLTKSVDKDIRSRALVTQVKDPIRDGNHAPAGIYIAAGANIRDGGTSRTYPLPSVAPTILSLFGLDAPEDMDGEVMMELFTPGLANAFQRRRSPSVGGRASTTTRPEFKYSPKDEQEIRDRLKNLGYLD